MGFHLGAAHSGGTFQFDWWRSGQGLPQTWVECITQTPDGYLWLGTRGGLVRLDGIEFTPVDDALPPAFRPASSEQR